MSRKPAVLVVDDEALIRLFAIDALDHAGISVISAASASEALKRLEQNPQIAVLFTDISMPGGMDGVKLARLIHQEYPELQLFLTSGQGMPSAQDMPPGSLSLAKPYSSTSIVKLIGAAIEKKSAQPSV